MISRASIPKSIALRIWRSKWRKRWRTLKVQPAGRRRLGRRERLSEIEVVDLMERLRRLVKENADRSLE